MTDQPKPEKDQRERIPVDQWLPKIDIPVSRDIRIRCVCCDKPLLPVDEGDREAHTDMWNGAVVDRMTGGYGSTLHDTSMFIVGICDDCLASKRTSGAVHFCGNGLEQRYADAGPAPAPPIGEDDSLLCPTEHETATKHFDPAGYDANDCAGCGLPKSLHRTKDQAAAAKREGEKNFQWLVSLGREAMAAEVENALNMCINVLMNSAMHGKPVAGSEGVVRACRAGLVKFRSLAEERERLRALLNFAVGFINGGKA